MKKYTSANKEDFVNPEHYKRYLKNLKLWTKSTEEWRNKQKKGWPNHQMED